jgi:hypothetical protein
MINNKLYKTVEDSASGTNKFETIRDGLSIFEEYYEDIRDDIQKTLAGAIFRDISGVNDVEFSKILWVDIVAPPPSFTYGSRSRYPLAKRMRVVPLREDERDKVKIFVDKIDDERDNLEFTAIDLIELLKSALDQRNIDTEICYYLIFVDRNIESERSITGQNWFRSGKVCVVYNNTKDNLWYINHKDLQESEKNKPIDSRFQKTIDFLKNYENLRFYVGIDYSVSSNKTSEKVQLWAAFSSFCDMTTIGALKTFTDQLQQEYLKPLLNKYELYDTERFLDTLSQFNHDDYNKNENQEGYNSIKNHFRAFVDESIEEESLTNLIYELGLNWDDVIYSLKSLCLYENYGSISNLIVIFIVCNILGVDIFTNHEIVSKKSLQNIKKCIGCCLIDRQSKETLKETVISIARMFLRLFYNKYDKNEINKLTLQKIEISDKGIITIVVGINPLDGKGLFATTNVIIKEFLVGEEVVDNRTASRSIFDFWLRSNLVEKEKYDSDDRLFKSKFRIECGQENDKNLKLIMGE